MPKSYTVKMVKSVYVYVSVETEHDGELSDDEIKALADDVFINQLAQGPVWLKDCQTDHVESIKEDTDG